LVIAEEMSRQCTRVLTFIGPIWVGCIEIIHTIFYWNGPNRHDLFRNGKEVYYEGSNSFPRSLVKEASIYLKNKNKPFFYLLAVICLTILFRVIINAKIYQEKRTLLTPRDLYAAFLLSDKMIALEYF